MRSITSMALCALISLALMASGCVGRGQPDSIRSELEAKYVGKSADAFFLDFGPPAEKQQLSDGATVYTWIRSSEMFKSNKLIKSEERCIIGFVADKGGVVTKFNRVEDSLGAWDLSYCREQLRRPT